MKHPALLRALLAGVIAITAILWYYTAAQKTAPPEPSAHSQTTSENKQNRQHLEQPSNSHPEIEVTENKMSTRTPAPPAVKNFMAIQTSILKSTLALGQTFG